MPHKSTLRLAACLTLLLLSAPVWCQDAAAAGSVPASWMQPIGGAVASTDTAATTDVAASVDNAFATPAVNTNVVATQPATVVDPNAPAVTTTDSAAVTSPDPAAATNPADPNAAAATTTVVPDPNAVAVPADPNAVATTPVTTPAVTPTDPNAVATTPAVTTPTTADPNAVATMPITDPAAGVIDPLAGVVAAPAPLGAQVGPANPVADPNALPTSVDDPFAPVPDAESNLEAELAEEEDTLPPAPPMDWNALPLDTAIVFGLALEGPSLVPWTKPKTWVFNNVLQQRYLRSCDIDDIETGAIDSYRADVPAPPSDGSRRRQALSIARRLLQDESMEQMVTRTGVVLRTTVLTNTIRVESEVRSVADGVSSGSLAKDLSMALGTEITNITMTQQPTTMPHDVLVDPNANTGGTLPGWIIGAIVGGILVLMPIPAYMMYKRHKRKHLEAVEKQQAEAAAARQRMQSRIIKSGGKSFSGRPSAGNDAYGDAHDILVQSGAVGYGYGPGGPGSMVEGSRQNSMNNLVMAPQRSDSFAALPLSPQRLLYQQNSLGPGAMPPPSPARAPSFAAARQHGSAVFPVRYSDEASTSSGNTSPEMRR